MKSELHILRQRSGSELLWLVLPTLGLLWAAMLRPLNHLDFWWHLKAGEIIVQTRSIPRTDFFSFTAEGSLYVLQNWLTEAIYFLVYSAGGLPLLITFNAVILAAAYLFSLKLCLKLTKDIRIAVIGSLPAWWALMLFGSLRPNAMSILLFSCFCWIVFACLSGKSNRIWLAPFLMALWVNLHGAFVLGLVLLLISFAAETVKTLVSPAAASRARRAAVLGATVMLALLATGLNPEGFLVWDYVRTVGQDPASQQWVTEWQSPSVRTLQGHLYFFLPFLIVFTAALYGRRKLPLHAFLFLLAFSAFAMTAFRNVVWFGLIAAPVFAQSLHGIEWRNRWRRFRDVSLLSRFLRQPQDKASDGAGDWIFRSVLATLLVLVTILATPWSAAWMGVADQIYTGLTPVRAVEFIRERRLEGRILNHQFFGDYMIWRLWPEQKTFIDGRIHLFGMEIVHDYMMLLQAEDWQRRLEKYEIDYVFMKRDGDAKRLVRELERSPDWREIYRDELAVIFERCGPSSAFRGSEVPRFRGSGVLGFRGSTFYVLGSASWLLPSAQVPDQALTFASYLLHRRVERRT